jgi:hypothetical protein
MAGNTGKGRPKGSVNRFTAAMQALAQDGESPCAFGIRLMRDESQPVEIRLHAARLAAPYVHPKPQLEPRIVSFDLPDDIDKIDGMLKLHSAILKGTAEGCIPLDEARELSAILETQRRLVETVELEARIAKLEQGKPK